MRPIDSNAIAMAANTAQAFVEGKPLEHSSEKVNRYTLAYELQNLGIFEQTPPF